MDTDTLPLTEVHSSSRFPWLPPPLSFFGSRIPSKTPRDIWSGFPWLLVAVTVQFLPRTPSPHLSRPQTLQSARRLLAGPRSACSQRQGQDVCQTHVTRACNQGKFYDYPHYELPRVPARQACCGMNRIPLRVGRNRLARIYLIPSLLPLFGQKAPQHHPANTGAATRREEAARSPRSRAQK